MSPREGKGEALSVAGDLRHPYISCTCSSAFHVRWKREARAIAHPANGSEEKMLESQTPRMDSKA